jgi:hypothetical protein
VDACGDAADTIYHQIAYEMVGVGVDRGQMVSSISAPAERRPVVSPADGRLVLSRMRGSRIGSVKVGIVPKRNPVLYALALAIAVMGPMSTMIGLAVRTVGLIVLGLVSLSLAWIGVALAPGRLGLTDHADSVGRFVSSGTESGAWV